MVDQNHISIDPRSAGADGLDYPGDGMTATDIQACLAFATKRERRLMVAA